MTGKRFLPPSAVLVLLAPLLQTCGFGGDSDSDCTPDPACVNTVVLTFVDPDENPLTDVYGLVGFDGDDINFDCSDENSTVCSENVLTLSDVKKVQIGVISADSVSNPTLVGDGVINFAWEEMEISQQGCNPECYECDNLIDLKNPPMP